MIKKCLALFASMVLLASPASAERASGTFVDPEDDAFDASEWLLDRKGFLPVPILITEPAVGYGGGVGLLFFRDSLRDASAKSGRVTPPDIYGVALAATENGTQVIGGGGMFTFNEDRWRYRGAVGLADVNLTFYGIGGSPDDESTDYNLDGWISSQQILRRLGSTDQFLAARWVYIDVDSEFETDSLDPMLSEGERASRSSGIGLSWEYDSRDTIFTASRGMKGALDTLFYEPAWGSENSFQTYRARLFGYVPVGKTLVIGGRVDGRAARVPFYQFPFIELRGIPVARYQDQNTAVVETEVRWNVTPRWALVGFIGAGRAWGRLDDFGDAGTQDAERSEERRGGKECRARVAP